ncbi:hypothetical protein ACQP3F_29840, partial [Escherichia coli]
MKDLMESLSQEMRTLQVSSGQRDVLLLPTAERINQPKIQASLKPGQAAVAGQVSLMQASIREA